MTDERGRETERQWLEDPSLASETRFLVEKLRRGEQVAGIELAAWLGHTPARLALGANSPFVARLASRWARGLVRWGKETTVRAFVATGRLYLAHELRAGEPDLWRLTALLDGADAWSRCPCAAHLEPLEAHARRVLAGIPRQTGLGGPELRLSSKSEVPSLLEALGNVCRAPLEPPSTIYLYLPHAVLASGDVAGELFVRAFAELRRGHGFRTTRGWPRASVRTRSQLRRRGIFTVGELLDCLPELARDARFSGAQEDLMTLREQVTGEPRSRRLFGGLRRESNPDWLPLDFRAAIASAIVPWALAANRPFDTEALA